MIRVEHLTKEFHIRGAKGEASKLLAVDDVSFTLRRGKTLAVVGESGSGKSTAANMILHLLEPTSGKIFFDGEDTSEYSEAQLFALRRRLQAVFQNPYGSLDPMYLDLPTHRRTVDAFTATVRWPTPAGSRARQGDRS